MQHIDVAVIVTRDQDFVGGELGADKIAWFAELALMRNVDPQGAEDLFLL
jgi:hypothetical protein